jgi:cytidyltransferase-like protein
MDNSSVLSDEDYDVISNPGQRSLESSIADLHHIPALTTHELPPSDAARERLSTVALSPVDIQAYVQNALSASGVGKYPRDNITLRVYVDGVFDILTAGHAHQLRQAKLSFPSVHLIVGVLSDEQCRAHNTTPHFSHLERCELMRHCRWVDEVLHDAPWTVNDRFIIDKRIDYLALEEGSSVNPEFDKERLKGYDLAKRLGRVLPTRMTAGVTAAPLLVSYNKAEDIPPFRELAEMVLEQPGHNTFMHPPPNTSTTTSADSKTRGLEALGAMEALETMSNELAERCARKQMQPARV